MLVKPKKELFPPVTYTRPLGHMLKSRPHIQAHLVLPTHQANAKKPKEPEFLPTFDRKLLNWQKKN